MRQWLPPTLILSALVLLLLAGCEDTQLESEQKELLDAMDSPRCSETQILVDGRCCEDADADGACDEVMDEGDVSDDACEGPECDAEETSNVTETSDATSSNETTDADLCSDRVCQETESCSSCAIDCCSITIDLEAYPSMMEGATPVVGDKAPSQDVATLTEIIFPLNAEGVSMDDQRLASEVTSLQSGNHLLVGSPCDNELVGKMYRHKIQTIGDCRIFESGVGVLRLVPTSSTTWALLVTGNSADEVAMAGDALAEYENHTLTGQEFTTR